MLQLRQHDALPDRLLQCEADELYSLLGGPTLLHLPGRQQQPLFVSILMHGNETTGWYALRELLTNYQKRGVQLPRSLSLFIGNVEAAQKGLRRLDGQPDFNRVWPMSTHGDLPEARLMQQVVDEMRRRQPFASIDIHNNTGLNPHYACINRLDDAFLSLASLFSRTVVYFTKPEGVQSLAMAQLCPAVTLECGRPEQAHGVEHAMEYVDAVLHMSQWPSHPPGEQDVDLFHTVAIVKVPEAVSFGFEQAQTDLSFADDLDLLNFRELPAGTLLGQIRLPAGTGLQVFDETGADVSARYLRVESGQLLLNQSVMPSMLTRDERVIRQDCFCYLMERYDDHLKK